MPIRFVRESTPFVLAHPVHLVFGPDESLLRSISGYVEEALGRTEAYWREWVHRLALPLEWQDAVIRAHDRASARQLGFDQRDDRAQRVGQWRAAGDEFEHVVLADTAAAW